MPIKVTNPSVVGGTDYGSPFVGPASHHAQIAVVLTGFTSAEIDSNGYLKPGTPVSAAGALVGSTVPVFGVVPEAIKVANGNAAGDISGAGTQQIAVATIGQVNRAMAESNLGRVYNANEVAGFALAPCTLKLL